MTMLRMATKLALLLCCSVAFAQDGGADLIDDFSSLTSDLNIDATVDTSQEGFIYNARLNSDGHISGRLQMRYPTGKTTPANATVQFSQDGEIITTTKTDDAGQFETAGLKPGTYLAKVAVGEDSAQVPVKVLEFDPAAESEMVIEGTLTPVPEGELIVTNGCDCGAAVVSEPIIESAPMVVESAPMEEIVVSESFVADAGCAAAPVATCGCEPAPSPCGFQASAGSCGGGCGHGGGGGFGGGGGIGGRRLGGLLGAAGLATGITALALDDDDAVSPASP